MNGIFIKLTGAPGHSGKEFWIRPDDIVDMTLHTNGTTEVETSTSAFYVEETPEDIFAKCEEAYRKHNFF